MEKSYTSTDLVIEWINGDPEKMKRVLNMLSKSDYLKFCCSIGMGFSQASHITTIDGLYAPFSKWLASGENLGEFLYIMCKVCNKGATFIRSFRELQDIEKCPPFSKKNTDTNSDV